MSANSRQRVSGEELRRLLQLRRAVAARRPRFVRQESWMFLRIRPSWRRPHGIHSKMREGVGGHPPLVRIGYRGPAAVRGLHPSGYEDVLVHNPEELAGLDPGVHAVRIASTVGGRKREEIIRRARALGLRILNA
ncbi:MAG: 50S ribosomal protein L32e [Nitrososphaeria archaeon]|jgi:large subunit ribosomal protein L32e